eukprot:CAMPEP_0172567932 /NCGR_PEP_ID=MMETSP1067-20121228/117807_1 /TAXON_ID=265564 ORGANISM="Thalassiosira punctigera, Strain Tpunct2005C2" /NCGR_SAMPLE_ID=MMETSP1067 /ASSEMBLY_ACC=CAM_ASM_000444 /LENGTH=265 /DNA_ID=CAMNT_0013359395 /DNA_START=90 /DNA_END=884 /DNA_ORIENTATION=+
MKAAGIFLSSLLFTTDGAMNLKIFRDPKVVYSKKPRNPCATGATRCEPPEIELLDEQGFLQSQDGIDRCLIENYFPGVCEGKYLEVGAGDGISFSNTFALFTVFGWKGVNIEIDPDNYEELTQNRQDDIANVQAAVCSETQKVHYAIGKDKDAGGIWEFSSESHRERWWPGMTLYNTIPLKCTPLQSILNQIETGKLFFDLATFDLEGAELSALLGIDFARISFGVIIVEKNENGYANEQIEHLLRSYGYAVSHAADKCSDRNVW